MASTLPSVSCLTLFACILGVDIHTRRMCVTDRPLVQVAAGTATSKAGEASALPQADPSARSLAGLDGGIELRVRQRDLVDPNIDSEPTGIVQDIWLDIELVRHGTDPKGETSSAR